MTAPTQSPAETLADIIAKVSSPNGWDWMFPLRVVPVDGKPTIVSNKGGNLFRGYIATWNEADLLVALANAAPEIVAALSATPRPDGGWRCFHCGDVFTDEGCARLHFGRNEGSQPACVIKAGAEQGLLGALRAAEYEAADARRAIADECTDAARAHYAQASRHDQALRNAEELGYERGLADARALPIPQPSAGEGSAGKQLADYSAALTNLSAYVFDLRATLTMARDLIESIEQGPGNVWSVNAHDPETAVCDTFSAIEAALATSPAPPAVSDDARLFDVLEALKPHFPRIAGAFARGTGGVELPFILSEIAEGPTDRTRPDDRVGSLWRERWYGSDPQRGSAIVDERGNLVAYFGGDEDTHRATTATVLAHNAAIRAFAIGQSNAGQEVGR